MLRSTTSIGINYKKEEQDEYFVVNNDGLEGRLKFPSKLFSNLISIMMAED